MVPAARRRVSGHITAAVGTWKKGVAGKWIKTAAYAGSIACVRVYFDDEFDD